MAKYNNSMPDKLLKAMSSGHSFEGACGVIGIGKTTGYRWCEEHGLFYKAKDQGDMNALKFFEQIAISKMTGVIPEGLKKKGSKALDTTMAIFMLKTRFHKIYGEKVKLMDATGDDKLVNIKLSYLDPKKKKLTLKKKKDK